MLRKLCFAWLCTCLSLVSTPARASDLPAGFHHLVMPNLRASIDYPAGWRPAWHKGRQFLYGPAAKNFTTNVNIYFVAHPKVSSLADFGKAIAEVARHDRARPLHHRCLPGARSGLADHPLRQSQRLLGQHEALPQDAALVRADRLRRCET
jgi:hypothetical protein